MLDRFGLSICPLPPWGRVGERAAFCLLAALLALPAHAQSDFNTWLAAFRPEALAQGITPATFDAALAGVRPVERVIELDRLQPEFLQTFSGYLGKRITPAQVARGREKLSEHAALLDAVEQRYGVPKAVLVAFWGLETRYGANLGSLNIPASLATLAWDGRRSAFFRSQLLDALRILDAGHVGALDMKGSWAGAMGHMQFLPSTFRAYAVDGDGDARIDLWTSLPDAMHSAANYLRRAGWRPGEPVALELRLPQNFDWRQARLMHRLPVADWAAAGVRTVDDGDLPTAAGRAAIVLPQGWQGPAFMVFDNFDVVMDWNRSINYALTVAQLARQLEGGNPLASTGGENGALGSAQMATLQQALNALGFDAGKADGLIGLRTQSALRRYQVRHQLPADGYPSPAVLAHVEQTCAAAAKCVPPAPAPTFADPEPQP
jgi:membrane-bound lytic murein transglycosylase B